MWFTGLSGAGKSTIANLVEGELHRRGHHTYLLDGDNVRHGLNADLGFTEADRVENIRRVAEVAKLMADAGPDRDRVVHLAVPRRATDGARRCSSTGEFLEVFVDTPLAVAEERDPKGLYKKARARRARRTSPASTRPYEPPERPEMHIDTTELSARDAARTVIERLEEGDVWLRRATSSESANPRPPRPQKYPSRFFFSIEAAASWSITRPWRSEVVATQHLADDLRRASSRVALDRARQRIAAQRAEADLASAPAPRRARAACARRRP